MSDDPRDPEEVATALSETLRELQGELRPRRRPPRPPTPRELLRFTDEYAIPALVSGLEASIRTLELLQGAIRLVERRPTGDVDRPDFGEAGRATLDRLDGLLADLGDAIEGEPSDPEARRLLAEARSLREELDAALAPAEETEAGRQVPVDVEGELRSIKEDVDDDS
jgi:hypothetical protein